MDSHIGKVDKSKLAECHVRKSGTETFGFQRPALSGWRGFAGYFFFESRPYQASRPKDRQFNRPREVRATDHDGRNGDFSVVHHLPP
jgi:hypothetical protein